MVHYLRNLYIYIWSLYRTWRQVLLLLDGLGYQVFFVRISPWFSDLQKKCPDCWSSYLRPNFVLICRPILGSVALLFELRKNTLEIFQLHQYLSWPILTLLVIFFCDDSDWKTHEVGGLSFLFQCYTCLIKYNSNSSCQCLDYYSFSSWLRQMSNQNIFIHELVDSCPDRQLTYPKFLNKLVRILN